MSVTALAVDHNRESGSARSSRTLGGYMVDVHGSIEPARFVLHYPAADSITCIGHRDVEVVVNFRYSSKYGSLIRVEPSSPGIVPFDKLWCGVVGDKLIARNGDSCFMQVNDGVKLEIFFEDGRVADCKVLGPNIEPIVQMLMPHQAFARRFDRVKQMLKGAGDLRDNDRAKREDRCFHELAAMMALSRRYPAFRAAVVDFIIDYDVPLRPTVFKHFNQACALADDLDSWMKLRAFNDPQVISNSAGAPRKGVPAAERMRKAARALRDQEVRAAMKGQARNDDSNNRRREKGRKNK